MLKSLFLQDNHNGLISGLILLLSSRGLSRDTNINSSQLLRDEIKTLQKQLHCLEEKSLWMELQLIYSSFDRVQCQLYDHPIQNLITRLRNEFKPIMLKCTAEIIKNTWVLAQGLRANSIFTTLPLEILIAIIGNTKQLEAQTHKEAEGIAQAYLSKIPNKIIDNAEEEQNISEQHLSKTY